MVGLSGSICAARKQASDMGLQQVVVRRRGCRGDLVAWRRCNGCDDGFLGLSSEAIRWWCKFGAAAAGDAGTAREAADSTGGGADNEFNG
ncbi:hypothetical protein D8674_020661 [Pyrus ussuriensis x Pyrus communis]|uniref:Uncharacterized protein n=1 Tax=Pyrus ussuriensis x Pyrus communis TaxID=2448454 RepID=A0A5N5HK84_9ROSA|nr:hypothetical protein D8674_020661 [Pyrus ussuriensis x Pyrus communis]